MPENCGGSDGNNAAVHQDPQLRKILDDYLCDREHAWYFSRCCFRWADGEKPETADAKGMSNDMILKLYEQGLSKVEIAKQLGRGLGEVNLVIELYKGDENL